jgi:hypothetical protein
VAVGHLMYYGRCVDARTRILPTICALASEQSSTTLGTLKLKRLDLDCHLGFVSVHRDEVNFSPIG